MAISRRFKYSTGSMVVVLIILGILVVVNFMSRRHFVRLDLTEGKDFTISDSTKKVLEELDDIVNINAYFSKDLPSYLIGLQRRMTDIFDEYEAFARGNLAVEFIDPAGDPALEQKVRFLGIHRVPFNIIQKDKAEVVNVYLGIAVMYEDRSEVIPVVQNMATLEYDLTSAILKVKRQPSDAKTIGFLTGHDEYGAEEDYQNARSSLERQYSLVDVDLSDGKEFPENVNTLVVGGPKESLSEREKYEIDQFLMRGGRIIFLIDPIRIDRRGLMAEEIDPGLSEMLEHYGVRVGKALVLDRANNSNASFSSGFVQYSLPYPFWPRITKNQFAEDSPMVNQLEGMILPWAGAVELISAKVGTGTEGDPQDENKLRGTELCRSSQYSWTKGKPYNLSPQQRFVPTGELKSYPLAAAVSGRFKSFYAGKPVPEPEKSGGDSPQVELSEESSPEETIAESLETQIIVVGNARFITDMFMGRSKSNLLFFQNAVDWLTMGEDLINIRSRFVTDRPLKDVSESSKLFIRIISICGAPFLVIAFGLTRFLFKRRAKKVFETYSAIQSSS